MLSFEAGCDWMPSLLSGYVYDFDGWHWLAARSDPVGQAWDLAGTIQDQEFPGLGFEPYPARHTEPFWNVKFTDDGADILHKRWDELDRMYLLNPAVENVFYRAFPDRLERSDLAAPMPAPVSPPISTPPARAIRSCTSCAPPTPAISSPQR